ncbi:MAG: FG-GAP-like repeat-containing protein [Hydrogenophaga sp.]|jgi:RHS repeat-associated protein|nr:FG-GAP-like repeat-containing protein [Hydrogenophaga sp.]
MSSSPSSVSDRISVPKGGGAISGLGETFKPDLHTGTGNFSVPITLPPGRNNLTPKIAIGFSTGAGNGPFGLGWSLSVPGVARRTEKGVPRYGADDVFVLSGTEDLVALSRDAQTGTTRYSPRTEGLFARITHHAGNNGSHWVVETKDGLTSVYGSPDPSRTPDSGKASAVISHPDDPSRVFAWHLTETRDPLGNRINYHYRQDGTQHYLQRIQYADLPERGQDAFLLLVDFFYDDEAPPMQVTPEVPQRTRPDPFFDCRAGFEIRTQRRCKWIVVNSHAELGRVIPVRAYELVYIDEQHAAGQQAAELPANATSLLARINVIGFDDEGLAHRETAPLDFGYSRFDPGSRRFAAVRGRDLPLSSLANPDMELVDLFGNGLPDIVELGAGGVRYWRNLGDGIFDLPRPFDAAPSTWRLSDAGVQLVDANGDGRADLLVTTSDSAGYWPLDFRGRFSPGSFRRYAYAPSFNLEDPEVRLLDLTGDGLTDGLRSGSSFECYFNDPVQGFAPERTSRIPRGRSQDFPDVSFADPRVKLADLNGDGLQDIALVHQSRVEYWPSLGYGRFGRRCSMALPAGDEGLPFQFDPARVLLGDVDGDGLADLIYVSDRSVTLWINSAGNGWSKPLRIQGAPAVDNLVTVRMVDLHGTGVAGLLWTREAGSDGASRHYFLDFTGGTKPYLLSRMDNHMGAVTEVRYAPSTRFYLRDERRPETRWRTTLPFPVQVVESVTVRDALSGGTFSTEYRYHHGYWDGVEREFRGFGLVEHTDTEVFDGYLGRGLKGDDAVMARLREQRSYAPPLLTRTWFHQGPVDPPDDAHWSAPDPRDEYWPGDPSLLDGQWRTDAVLAALAPGSRREALRVLRGSVLRSETYALDGSTLEERPYTVTEHAYGIVEIDPRANGSGRRHIFFPHAIAQRTTQWERGDDPATRFSIADEFDDYGQPRRQLDIACSRGWKGLGFLPDQPYLATLSITTYADVPTAGPFLADRVARTRTYELTQTNGQAVEGLFSTTESSGAAKRLIAETLNYYDGPAFDGLPFGLLGAWGVVIRSETLVLTEDLLSAAYSSARPPWLDVNARFAAGGDYPQGFANYLPAHAGYSHHPSDATFAGGWYVQTSRGSLDLQDPSLAVPPRGLLMAHRDPLGYETRIDYDALRLLPATVTGPTGLAVRAEYSPRVFQPILITDPNGNRTVVRYSPNGLVTETFVRGKAGLQEGDLSQPSTSVRYDLRAFLERGQPVHARTLRRVRHDSDPEDTGQTIETREYSDGFGRLLQTRTQRGTVRFGDPRFGNGLLPADHTIDPQRSVQGESNDDPGAPNVVVSGWQIYDRKGRIVEQYEPFFDAGWDYKPPSDDALGQKLSMFLDAQGRVVSTMHPDGSQQHVVHGIPHDLSDPPLSPLDSTRFRPSPWESTTYDANDNAGRTHAGISAHNSYRHHHDTPASVEVDALGRTIKATARHRRPLDGTGSPSPLESIVTRSTYDIQGNLTGIRDALGRLAFEYFYDLAGRPLHTRSIDAGPQWTACDAAGNVIEALDAKGALRLQAYDALHRPTRIWARDAHGEALTLRQRLTYGDDPAFSATAAASNLLGQLVRHDDEAGRVELAACDFKGNPLQTSRRVVTDAFLLASYQAELAKPSALRTWALPAPRIDWSDASADAALGSAYVTRSTYDALDRIVWSDYPEAANGERYRLRPAYNRAGALESVAVQGPLDANDQGAIQTFVQRIAYDAKGQRILIVFGNGILTRRAYDPLTFRLSRMRTERWESDPGDSLRYVLSGAPLQDISYRYDVSGNLLGTLELTPGCGVANHPEALLQTGDLRRLLSSGDALLRRFEYDPLYRLTSATGREAVNTGSPRPWFDLPRDGYNSDRHGAADQDNAPYLTAPYREEYDYDAAGNMLTMRHGRYATGTGWQVAWSRRFGMDGRAPEAWRNEAAQHVTGDWTNPASNRLTHVEDRASGTPAAPVVAQSHWYDAKGNQAREHGDRTFDWDHADRMKAFRNQIGNNRPTTYALYVYDATGMRVKKLVVTGGDNYHTTTYVGSSFEHHTEQRIDGSSRTENCSLHVMDGVSRIAILRAGPAFPDDGAAEHAVQYHFGDHLGNSSVVVASGGEWINREECFPYGDTSFGGFARKRYRLTGKERDEESSLHYFGSRLLSSWVARWISADHTSPNSDGLNGYCFLAGRVLVAVDPGGNFGFLVIVGIAILAVLANPGVANAPGPKDQTIPMSEVQVYTGTALSVAAPFVTGPVASRIASTTVGKAIGPVGSNVAANGSVGFVSGTTTQAATDFSNGTLSSPDRYLASGVSNAAIAAPFGLVGNRGAPKEPTASARPQILKVTESMGGEFLDDFAVSSSGVRPPVKDVLRDAAAQPPRTTSGGLARVVSAYVPRNADGTWSDDVYLGASGQGQPSHPDVRMRYDEAARALDVDAPGWSGQCAEANSLDNFAASTGLAPYGAIPGGGYMSAMNTAAHPTAPYQPRPPCNTCSVARQSFGYEQSPLR